MEINIAITGWEKGQMRIWQDVRVEMDFAEIGWLLGRHYMVFKVDFVLHV